MKHCETLHRFLSPIILLTIRLYAYWRRVPTDRASCIVTWTDTVLLLQLLFSTWTVWVSTRLWGSDIGRGKRFFCSFPKRTHRLRGPPNLLFSSLKGVKQSGAWTTHLYVVPRWRMSGALPLFSLYAFVAWTEKTLPVFYRYCDVPLHWQVHFYVTFLSSCIALFKL